MIIYNELPFEIQERMLENQVLAGNPRDPLVFINNLHSATDGGGFDWDVSPEEQNGEHFWLGVLMGENPDMFFERYPRFVHPVKPEFHALYKKTFKVNDLRKDQIDLDRIRELKLDYLLLTEDEKPLV